MRHSVGRKVALSRNIAQSVAISTLGLKVICPRISCSNFRCARGDGAGLQTLIQTDAQVGLVDDTSGAKLARALNR
jgi:hypothetical protein